MNQQDFAVLMAPVIDFTAGKPVDRALADALNQRFPGASPEIRTIERACHDAIAAGWMCSQGGAGRRFGRVIEATPDTRDLSVDVVDLTEVVGPLHRHPDGEVCLVMPVDETAKFDGKSRGWCVYGPGSAHRPTVKGGRALVLYLLPGGKIEFQE
ncbi:DUF4863 family protein [Magnetospirillum sp. SS-4]|uniref:4-hydroxylaminobenzoate lyase n=1 Tax=Magnetospirillum sp. SS-4 TaxID=2681465 RepID=UPI001385818A|nr:DUF4863 family protein [Magnetospirillum sp. SS-4]CAA7627538.1 conserved hypothetical protein [Magnetospirillum sp. SS-4]